MVDSNDLEHDLDRLRRRAGVAGMVAALLRNGDLVWSVALGQATPGRACTVETSFEVASLTKPVASIPLLRLVRDGRLRLDEPIAPYVPPQSPFAAAIRDDPPIQVGHVWSHTSGLRLLQIGPRRRHSNPGTTFRYNGAAFALLTSVIEQRTGHSIDDALSEVLPRTDRDHPTMYWRRPGGISRRRLREPTRPIPLSPRPWERMLGLRPGPVNAGAGLTCTIGQLADLDRRIDSGDVMDDTMKDLAWSPVPLADGTLAPYGRGWFVTDWNRERAVWHYGHRPGINSALWIKLPDRRVSFIALANSSGLSATTRLGQGDLASSPLAELAHRLLTS